ncbi:MAG: arsenate reductase ArsC [Desulfobacteraceae bacterium]
MQKNVLFICRHNSGRSQMAEAMLNRLGKGWLKAESAGLEPKSIDGLVVTVMDEIGYDLSRKRSKDVFSFYKQGRLFDYVITVCDKETEDGCPVFPGIVERLNWPFEDPSEVQGDDDERLSKVRNIRDAILLRIELFIKDEGFVS